MKEFLFAAVLSTSIMGGVAMFAVPDGGWSKGHSDRMKGRPSSYRGEEGGQASARASGTGGEALQVALRGVDDGLVFLRVDFDFDFIPGPDMSADDIEELREQRKRRLDHALTIELSDFDVSTLDDGPGKYALKRKLRDIVQREFFAEDEALVEDILFRELVMQFSR